MNFLNILASALAKKAAILALSILSLSQAAFGKVENIDYLTAAEDIAVMSQSLVKNYFYLGENLNASRSEQMLSEHIANVDASLSKLKSFKNQDQIEDDLMFVEMIWAEFKDTLNQEYSRDTGLLVIDMGEVLLEGSENIARVLYGTSPDTGEMIDVIEQQRYLIERMAKLYIISIAGFKDFNVAKQTTSTVKNFDEGLAKIESNGYPQKVQKKISKLRKRWDSSRSYYLKVEEGDLPRTVFFNTEMIERLLLDIFKYHKL